MVPDSVNAPPLPPRGEQSLVDAPKPCLKFDAPTIPMSSPTIDPWAVLKDLLKVSSAQVAIAKARYLEVNHNNCQMEKDALLAASRERIDS